MEQSSNKFSDLIAQLDQKLQQFGYAQDREASISGVQYVAYVKNKSILKVRNLCALVEIQGNITEISDAHRIFKSIKRNLLGKYGEAFLWKELEMSLVILCPHSVFCLLKADDYSSVNHASFSMNSLMGSSFVDEETYEHVPRSTWGLYFSGDHFKAIIEVVENWCKDKRKLS